VVTDARGTPNSILIPSNQDNDNQDNHQDNEQPNQRGAMRVVVIIAAKSFYEHG
jgi:hypothetical protein